MENQCDIKKAGNVEFRCYFQLASMVIGGKWKPKVLFHLAQNEVVRFGELRRAVFGITEKMLIQSLKELEKDGLVNRKVYRQVPPKVEYRLTPLGVSLIPALMQMREWGMKYERQLGGGDGFGDEGYESRKSPEIAPMYRDNAGQ